MITLEDIQEEELSLSPFGKPNKNPSECLPREPSTDMHYIEFKIPGQRIYPLDKEIPLRNSDTQETIANIIIKDATHYLTDGKPTTSGNYRIMSLNKNGE